MNVMLLLSNDYFKKTYMAARCNGKPGIPTGTSAVLKNKWVY